MDEIFKPSNFIANIIWQKKYSPQNDALFYSAMHDHILSYAKDIRKCSRNLIPRTDKQDKAYKNPGNDQRGDWKASDLTRAEHRDRDFYGIVTPSGKTVYPAKGRSWSRPPEEIDRLRNDNRLWFGKNGDAIPSLKRFLSEVKQGVVPTTIWMRDEVGDNQEAKQEVKTLNPEAIFSTPKPTRLIQRILQIATDKDSLVLDSFAGSGTTGHAVLAQNKEDGGNRRFITIEMDESICQNITAQRLTRVIEGTEKIESLGSGFRFCTLSAPLFDELGHIRRGVTYAELAAHVFFTETGSPIPAPATTPKLGVYDGKAVYLLFNGILGDKRPEGGNILTPEVLKSLPAHKGVKVIYGESCALPDARLRRDNIVFKQVPYHVQVS